MKSTIMQIEKALISGRLRVWKVSWKFRIPAISLFVICVAAIMYLSLFINFLLWRLIR